MPIERSGLLDLLEEVDRKLKKPITIIAAGGTAMTLLGFKRSTIDIDFDLSGDDAKEFRGALKAVAHGFRIDIFTKGMIFSQQLPDDYAEKSIAIKTGLKKIKLRVLHPIDIVASKIGRLNERDMQDIGACIGKYKLTADQIKQRAESVQYVGRDESYADNIKHVLRTFFAEK
jgi:hypothetical protein